MYCPKCKIDLENEKFCEICGSETVSKLDSNNSEINKNSTIPVDDRKSFVKKLNIKSLIKFSIVAVIAVILFVGYGSLKAMYSADKTIERYVSYLTEGKSKEAFKMLDIKESEFVNSELFDKYIKKLDVTGKKSFIRVSEDENKLYNVFSNIEKQYSNLMPRDIKFYNVQIESEVYPIAVIKRGKKLGIFDNWIIGSYGLTKEWRIQAPKGAKVYIEGKEIEQIEETKGFNVFNSLFSPENSVYIIKDIFPNDYEVTATLEGAKDIRKVASPNDPISVLGFEMKEELQDELVKIVNDFIELYYSNASITEYENIVHRESNFFNQINNQYKIYNSKTFKSLEVVGSSIDDIKHARLEVVVNFDYEQEEIANWFTGESKINKGTSLEIIDFSFRKEGDRWIIVNTSFL